MTASVGIEEGNGPIGSIVWTPVATVRYCTADVWNPSNSYPNVVPATNFNYSYVKWTRLAFSGTFSQVSNFRWYCSGRIAQEWSLGTGGMLMLFRKDSVDNGCPANQYSQAGGIQGQTGYYGKDPTNGLTYYKDETADPYNADLATSANPFPFDSSVYTTAGATKSLASQLKIAPNALQGEKGGQVGTVIYDEI